MTFRICTFNAGNRARGLAFLERRVNSDLVLVQETTAAHWRGAYLPVQLLQDRTTVGATAILSPVAAVTPLRPRLRSRLGSSSPTGAITAALVTPEGSEPFVAVSVYTRIDRNVAFWNAQKLVDDLEPLIAASRGRLVIGGDFNAWDQLQADRLWHGRWHGLWSRMEELGMVNLLRETRAARIPLVGCECGLADGCWHVQTVRRRSRVKACTDYLWATPELAKGCRLEVMDIHDDELVRVSDHSPVWADLAL